MYEYEVPTRDRVNSNSEMPQGSDKDKSDEFVRAAAETATTTNLMLLLLFGALIVYWQVVSTPDFTGRGT